jgi:hypothetical protein
VAGRFSTTVRRSYFRRGQHAVLVPTAEIKPHDALRMSQLRKLSRLVSQSPVVPNSRR